MSNKSGTSSQVISLPQGGGALHGIGEKFSPDLFTGTGNFTVPIALPPGRNGFQPELNLVYSTGNGNGVFGVGWGLSIPGVSRKTSKGIPRYEDDRDVFILSGAEDLVPIAGGEEEFDTEIRYRTRYRPRTEGLFARIEHHRVIHKQSGVINDYWEVRSKDGLVSFYGTPQQPSGASKDWKNPAAIANPDPLQRDNIFAWKLTQTIDPFGNRIEFEYERDSGIDGPHHWDQLYLKRIRYADYGNLAQPQFLASVTFEYAERPDPFSEYRSGFEIRTRKRCKRILIHTHADRERLVRTYDLVYLDQLNLPPERLPLNGVSLLSQIQVTGHDENRSESLPPLEFGYTSLEPASRVYKPFSGVKNYLPEYSLGHTDYELVDLFGNGLPDVIQMNGSIRYWRNLGHGIFDFPRKISSAPAGVNLASSGVQMADLDGDGRTDLLVTDGMQGGYYSLTFNGEWNRRSFTPYRRVPSINLEDSNVKLVDLDGDGITDALFTNTQFELYYNNPDAGWEEVEIRSRDHPDRFPDVNLSDPRVKLADITGDGLQDIVLIYNGRIEYWPYLGYGQWGQRIVMKNSPRLDETGVFSGVGYDPKRLLLGDLDGDGCADLVYVDSGHVTVWINQSGNQWSEPIKIHGTPLITDVDAVRLADMHGTGTLGILWTYDFNAQRDSTYKFLDLTGGRKPYLLNQINNNLGTTTLVEYASSTQYYLEDERRPETCWKTTLPFPVQVIARVEAIDEISRGKLTTEYRYHHGYWDGVEREFRGFGRVEQLDTETFEVYDRAGLHGENIDFESVDKRHFSPPTLTKTWFHQGPVMDESGDWAEADYRDEYWSEDPSLLARPEEMQQLLKALPRPARRDALRTLRGQMLRTELYALDGTPRQNRPYTVTEALSGVQEVEPPPDPNSKRQRIFFPHELAQRVTQWERGDDPMTQFSFTQDYDVYGQPRTQIQIACPRGWRTLADRPSEPYLATLSRTEYTESRDDATHYMVDRVAYTTAYEIPNKVDQTVLELQKRKADRLSVIGQSFNYYDGPAFEGMELGKVGDYGLVARTEVLIVTQDILNTAYKDKDGVEALPPYFTPEPVAWPGEYPADFRQAINALPGNLGYTEYKENSDDPHEEGYFVTAYQQYDVQEPQVNVPRGLLLASRDALGRETKITYDAYNLLPVKVIDPAHLEVEAQYDYRVLQPRQTIDSNGNRSVFAFSPLGLLASTVVMGKPGEQVGDTQKTPGSWLEYDFFAFEKSGQPIWVRTIQREEHYWDAIREENEKRARNGQLPLTDAEIANLFPNKERELKQFPERFLQTVEYSDGFGRLLQTRTQAEDLTFGDNVFGNGVLPTDQRDDANTKAAVVGRQRSPQDPVTVLVSGWQIYDNKGRVVEKYEPFYSQGWGYIPPTDKQRGQKATLFYDPRGQMIRTVNPNGSEQLVIYGVPPNLDDPERFQPTAWEVYTYDENDNARRTHRATSQTYRHHWNTPSSAVVDALGRTVQTTERNGSNPDTDWYRTTSTYDIRGNLLTVRDALGRLAFRYTYDLTPSSGEEEDEEGAQVLHIWQLDAGVRRMVFDAVGNERERRDSKGAVILQDYDILDRPRHLWARDTKNEPLTLRELLIYGDGGDISLLSNADKQARQAQNLLGELHQHYDEAGRQIFGPYDFKGNLRQKLRQVISDTTILQVQEFRVDWQPPANQSLEQYAKSILDARIYETNMTYDGLDRVTSMTYPEDTNGQRQVLRPSYNRAGALERVSLDGQPYVNQIAYNAKGQRSLIAYGNGLMTRYAYEPETFRLARLRTEKFTQQGLTYTPTGAPLQDFAYRYDLAGNILSIQDRTPGCGVQNEPLGANVLDRQFTYDPLYRLLSATGRECKDIPKPRPWDDEPRSGFNQSNHGLPNQHNAPNLTALYRETYAYDAAGNMLNLQHQQAVQRNGGSSWETTWTRNFGMGEMTPEDWAQTWRQYLQQDWPDAPGNKLTHVEDRRAGLAPPPMVKQTHFFDANGNLTKEKESRHFEWDHSDRMREFRTQTLNGPETIRALYLYNSAGMRVKKLVLKPGNQPEAGMLETTTYIDEVFEHHQRLQAGTTKENSWLHLMDGKSRMALLRVGQPLDAKDVGPGVQYCLGDHLGSSNLVVDKDGNWVNREEFTPYGETSFGGFGKKRYRFTGKERDEESGLNYHRARYYAPNLEKWISLDPLYLGKRKSNPVQKDLFSINRPFPIQHITKNLEKSFQKSYYFQEKQLLTSGLPNRSSNHQQLNLYSYVASNPLLYIDPNGFDLTVTGSATKDFLHEISNITGLKLSADKNGIVKIVGKVKGTNFSKSAEKLVRRIIQDRSHHVKISTTGTDSNLVYGASREGPGNYYLDMADFKRWMTRIDEKMSKAVLMHELHEAYLTAHGMKYEMAHAASIFFENTVLKELGSEARRQSEKFIPHWSSIFIGKKMVYEADYKTFIFRFHIGFGGNMYGEERVNK